MHLCVFMCVFPFDCEESKHSCHLVLSPDMKLKKGLHPVHTHITWKMCIRLLDAFIQVKQIHSNHYHSLYYSCRFACIAQQMKTQRLMNPSAKVQIIVAMEMHWWEGQRCPRQRTREKGSREREMLSLQSRRSDFPGKETVYSSMYSVCVCVCTCKWISCNYSKMGLSGQEEECVSTVGRLGVSVPISAWLEVSFHLPFVWIQ